MGLSGSINIAKKMKKSKKVVNKKIQYEVKNDCLNLFQKDINDEMIPDLCKWIEQIDHNIKSIDLSQNTITSKGATMLFQKLKECNPHIAKINLFDNQLNDNCMKSLGEYIQNSSYIECVLVSGNNHKITDSGINILAPYLIGNTTLKSFGLSGNKGITNKSIPLLKNMIEKSNIEEIYIGATSITNQNIFAVSLTGNILKNGNLDKINFSDKELTDEDVIKTCEIIKSLGCIKKLKEINLSYNKITPIGANVLFQTLKECNSSIVKVDLYNNKLTDGCMESLGELLQNNQFVEYISIGKNNITDKGVDTLTNYLLGNVGLKSLNIYGNKDITDKSIPLLNEMIEKSNIQNLTLDGTSISNEEKQGIQSILKTPIDQREIPLITIGNVKSAAKSYQ